MKLGLLLTECTKSGLVETIFNQINISQIGLCFKGKNCHYVNNNLIKIMSWQKKKMTERDVHQDIV